MIQMRILLEKAPKEEIKKYTREKPLKNKVFSKNKGTKGNL